MKIYTLKITKNCIPSLSHLIISSISCPTGYEKLLRKVGRMRDCTVIIRIHTKYYSGSPENQNQEEIYIYKEIYYKELVHVTMEAERSHNLWSASWRAKGASSVVPV